MKKSKKLKFSQFSLSDIHFMDVALAMIILVAFISIFFVLYRKPTTISVSIKVGDENIMWPTNGAPDWYIEQIKPGLKEQDILGRTTAEITKVFSYPREANKNLINVEAKIRALYSKNSSSYTYKGRPILIGNSIRLNTEGVQIEGIVKNFSISDSINKEIEKEKIIVSSQIINHDPTLPHTRGTDSYKADSFEVGDTITNQEGGVVITVIDKQVRPAKRIISTNTGRVTVVQDPILKDIFITLEVNADKMTNGYFLFGELKIAIDTVLPLQFDNASLFPTTTSITASPEQ